MVKGEWIIFPEARRCKNWVNGIEVVFDVDDADEVVGIIRYIPPELSKQISTPFIFSLYVYKMWRQATELFKKIYYKKKRRSL
ncbi:MAG: hypothetical protein LBQ38_07230 [Spirochaetaceae bacterium]|jgi:hypothetical protein|nr:hypothetical protein [Spirochaetaceae bacterium]